LIEQTIISSLVSNNDFMRKAIPHLREEFFHDVLEKTIFNLVSDYIQKYNKSPTKSSLQIDLSNMDTLSEDQFKGCEAIINNISNEVLDLDYLLDTTEKFCKDKSVYNALMESIKILDSSESKDSIPDLLQKALSVTFDPSIGHDLIEDWEAAYEFYHRREEKIQFDIDYLNKCTQGGLPRKSLNVVLAGTNVGKSMALCHFAASNLSSGHDVLYITMEMAEERIAERIYANLMDIPIGQLSDLPKQDFERKINQIEQKTQGRLVIKEYPTASAHSGHFEALLQELRTKRNFIPGIIYIDYLNICSSRNVKFSYGANTYVIVKAIAEELRAIGQKYNLPIVTATQTTRSGFTSSDPGLEDTSESFGLPATADFMVSMIRTDDLDALNQVQFKQLKNRYGNQNLYKRFVVGFDMDKMRLYDVEQNAQDDIIDDSIPIMDEKWSPPNRSELFKEFK